MKTSNKRLFGCFGVLLLIVGAAVVTVPLMREWSLERLEAEQQARQRKYMAEQIAEVRSGDCVSVSIYSPICLEDLMVAVDCVPRVKKVFLSSDLSDERWRLLKQLPHLEEIGSYGSSGTDTLLEHIQGMESLECIRFHKTPLSDAGMKYIATLPNLKYLIIMGGSGVTNAGLAHLEGHANLETLELYYTQVTDKGLVVLKEIPKLRYLAIFDEPMRGPRLTDAGLKHLDELTNLKTLGVGGGWASEAAVHDLREALPNCTINGRRKAE